MIVLIGESASGKSTIEKELTKYGYNRIISYTTRPIRTGEKDGIDYHYIQNSDFENKLKDGFFAEHAIYNEWYYGVAKEDCLDDRVVVVEPKGFRQLQQIKDLNLTSFYIKVSERKRLKRMVDRGDDLMEVFRRIFSDQGVFQGIDEEVDYVIENNDLDTAVKKVLDITKPTNNQNNKIKLFLDFDSTIVDSGKAICSLYNKLYEHRTDFVPADMNNCKQWNMKDICPFVPSILNMFSSKLFFNELNFFPNAKNVIEELCKKYDVYICSIGEPSNIALKVKWLEKNLPCVKNYIMLTNHGNKMDKSVIDMAGGIFVDDNVSNLESSNADTKICFGKTFPWNESWLGIDCFDWQDIKEILL